MILFQDVGESKLESMVASHAGNRTVGSGVPIGGGDVAVIYPSMYHC